MSLETLGTVLILRMELVLDIGFRVDEIACRHLDIFGNTVVSLCDIYIPYFHCFHFHASCRQTGRSIPYLVHYL